MKGRAGIYFSRSVGKDMPTAAHPACCVRRTVCRWNTVVGTLADSFSSGIS